MKCVRSLLPVVLLLVLQGCGSGVLLPAFPVASSIPPTTVAANDKVVFIGDSLTEGWPGEFGFSIHSNWIKKGIGGQTSTQIAMRYQADVVDLHPGTVHILVGTNDTTAGWTLCNPILKGKATATEPPAEAALSAPADTCSNIYYMLETAKRSGIKAVIGTIPPWGCADNPSCLPDDSARRERIATLNGWIADFARQEGATLVDYHHLLTNAEGLRYANGLSIDGVHPTPAGYAIMQPAVEAALR